MGGSFINTKLFIIFNALYYYKYLIVTTVVGRTRKGVNKVDKICMSMFIIVVSTKYYWVQKNVSILTILLIKFNNYYVQRESTYRKLLGFDFSYI
jgi:hypothetical protein